MTEESEFRPLTSEELTERAAMSLINANVAAPVNAAVADRPLLVCSLPLYDH